MLALASSCGRCRYCTRQRMQLVVMAAALVLAEVGQVSSFSCHPKNVSIPVESCGISGCVHTTICEGRCYHEDPNYISYEDHPKEKICSGDWSYEVKFIEGCPVGFKYPVAKSCECTTCNTRTTYCGRLSADMPSC
uniref:Follicle stimulating hormone subunit beta n=3 Tax=Oryzias latipes TaxID=8090 RepID=A0A3B3H6G3_ORYLA